MAQRTAVVTGGSIGIGDAIVSRLAAEGVQVVSSQFRHPGVARDGVTYLTADLSTSAGCTDFVAQAAERLGGRIDILVNNAGGMVARQPIADMSDEHWDKVMAVNLSNVFWVTRAALPHIPDGGRIVNMSSLAASSGGGPGAAAYAASKAAVEGLTHGMAKEFGPRGITVNAVAPGLIVDTPFHVEHNTPAGIERSITGIPVQRAGVPDDVAAVVVGLASPAYGFVTGTTVAIDGGALS